MIEAETIQPIRLLINYFENSDACPGSESMIAKSSVAAPLCKS